MSSEVRSLNNSPTQIHGLRYDTTGATRGNSLQIMERGAGDRDFNPFSLTPRQAMQILKLPPSQDPSIEYQRRIMAYELAVMFRDGTHDVYANDWKYRYYLAYAHGEKEKLPQRGAFSEVGLHQFFGLYSTLRLLIIVRLFRLLRSLGKDISSKVFGYLSLSYILEFCFDLASAIRKLNSRDGKKDVTTIFANIFAFAFAAAMLVGFPLAFIPGFEVIGELILLASLAPLALSMAAMHKNGALSRKRLYRMANAFAWGIVNYITFAVVGTTVAIYYMLALYAFDLTHEFVKYYFVDRDQTRLSKKVEAWGDEFEPLKNSIQQSSQKARSEAKFVISIIILLCIAIIFYGGILGPLSLGLGSEAITGSGSFMFTMGAGFALISSIFYTYRKKDLIKNIGRAGWEKVSALFSSKAEDQSKQPLLTLSRALSDRNETKNGHEFQLYGWIEVNRSLLYGESDQEWQSKNGKKAKNELLGILRGLKKEGVLGAQEVLGARGVLGAKEELSITINAAPTRKHPRGGLFSVEFVDKDNYLIKRGNRPILSEGSYAVARVVKKEMKTVRANQSQVTTGKPKLSNALSSSKSASNQPHNLASLPATKAKEEDLVEGEEALRRLKIDPSLSGSKIVLPRGERESKDPPPSDQASVPSSISARSGVGVSSPQISPSASGESDDGEDAQVSPSPPTPPDNKMSPRPPVSPSASGESDDGEPAKAVKDSKVEEAQVSPSMHESPPTTPDNKTSPIPPASPSASGKSSDGEEAQVSRRATPKAPPVARVVKEKGLDAKNKPKSKRHSLSIDLPQGQPAIRQPHKAAVIKPEEEKGSPPSASGESDDGEEAQVSPLMRVSAPTTPDKKISRTFPISPGTDSAAETTASDSDPGPAVGGSSHSLSSMGDNSEPVTPAKDAANQRDGKPRKAVSTSLKFSDKDPVLRTGKSDDGYKKSVGALIRSKSTVLSGAGTTEIDPATIHEKGLPTRARSETRSAPASPTRSAVSS